MDLMKELESAEKEIFRFEALQEYFSGGTDEEESEINRQWRETGEIDMDLMKEWHDFIQKKTAAGVKFLWIRLVKFPLNEYTKSSLYIYQRRARYGIDMRIITQEVFDTLDIELKDFYVVDDKAALMNYGKSNEFLNCEASQDSEKYKKYHDLLIKNSIPVREFKY